MEEIVQPPKGRVGSGSGTFRCLRYPTPNRPLQMRLLIQQAWTAPCSKAHRAFSLQSRPFGFEPNQSSNKKNRRNNPRFFLLVDLRGLRIRDFGHVCRPAPAHSAGLDRSLFESTPGFLTTVAPFRVRAQPIVK